jgi:hypothetical protein
MSMVLKGNGVPLLTKSIGKIVVSVNGKGGVGDIDS